MRRLTIGSSSTQHLQLTSPGVDERHAVLVAGLFGRLRIKCLNQQSVQVNGRRVQTAILRPGDVVEIGTAKLTLRASQAERLWVLVADEQSSTDPTAADQRDITGASAPVVRLASWSLTLAIGISVLFLFLPMSSIYVPEMREALRSIPFVPSDSSTWSPGSLHAAHRSIGDRCEACHAKPFEPVRNEECLACHSDVRRHVPLQSTRGGTADRERCTQCHLEHSQPSALMQRDQRMCSDCHSDLEMLKPGTRLPRVTDFDTDHPEFRVSALTSVAKPDGAWSWRTQRLDHNNPVSFLEQSHLRFSHRKHLDPAGIKSPQGERVLDCQDCHRPDVSGRYMRPVQMEAHCASCHSLKFDERDPSSAVPHGDLNAVFRKLQEHFSSEFLSQDKASGSAGVAHLQRPGRSSHTLSPEEDRRAREWVDSQSLRIARELLEKRVCADCHEVLHDSNAAGFAQWRIVPVRLTTRWMPRAQFDHAKHSGEKCTSCHETAMDSEATSDILLPRIARCRQCHGGAAAAAKVSSDCVMCHAFHIPTHEPWGAENKVAALSATPDCRASWPNAPARCRKIRNGFPAVTSSY